ncbi:MAG: hypothetical protein NC548_36745 [Lachnospiraceae bacterium]|nr:hypothetical protein [Lachnospiraceae bacterium]
MGVGFYLYLILNVFIFIWYYKKEFGVFQGPFLIAYTSIFVLLPQLMTIYLVDYYQTDSFDIFIYTILGCNIAFVIGFELSKRKFIPKHKTLIRFSKIKYLVYVFALIGIYSMFTWNDTYQGSDNVIQANLRSFASYGLCLISPFLIREKCSSKQVVLAIMCIMPIAYFAFFVKGSRGALLSLILIISFILSLRYPLRGKKIKRLVVALLLFGAVASASISLIRHILVGDAATGEKASVTELSLIDSYKKSFAATDISVGLDLGNAAIGIDYLWKSAKMDWGISYIWDDFIQNYVPRRVVGESFKESLKVRAVNDKRMVEHLTHGITTMTGYYYAFRSFNILAPLLFLFLGYLIGYLWVRIGVSMACMFVYFVVFTQIPLLLTHGPGYIYSGLEFILLLVFPFLHRGVYKARIYKS